MSLIHLRCIPLVMLFGVIALCGCKAKPAPSVGFADDAIMARDPSVPFHRFWRKADVDWKRYDKLYVADVNTSYMLKMTDWQKGERKEDIERDVQALGVYTRDTIKKAFRDDPNQRFTVLEFPTQEPDTLVFEIAIIEVIPSKVLLNALGYAPFGVGLSINVVRTLANDKSSVAFEARARDAASGEILMLAADREMQQQAIVDTRGLNWYSHAHGIIKEWARQFVQVVDQKPGQKIKDTPSFRLEPW